MYKRLLQDGAYVSSDFSVILLFASAFVINRLLVGSILTSPK